MRFSLRMARLSANLLWVAEVVAVDALGWSLLQLVGASQQPDQSQERAVCGF